MGGIVHKNLTKADVGNVKKHSELPHLYKNLPKLFIHVKIGKTSRSKGESFNLFKKNAPHGRFGNGVRASSIQVFFQTVSQLRVIVHANKLDV